MIRRGSAPEWNQKLIDANAAIVEKSIESRICYITILEKHLKTTVDNLSRTFKSKETQSERSYNFTSADAEKETDEFLERSGPSSFEMPWHRDRYYNLEAYVPNRKWSKDKEKWLYFSEGWHDRDLEWVQEKFTPESLNRDATGSQAPYEKLATGEAPSAPPKILRHPCSQQRGKDYSAPMDEFTASFKEKAKV